MLIHASCAVRDDVGVLIRGRAGSGKSDLLLRLLGRGFELVADDCVLLEDGVARAPERLRGLIEIRGVGIYRRTYRASARVGLVIEAGVSGQRIADPGRCPETDQPLIRIDLLASSATEIVSMAVSCISGEVHQVAGPL